MIEGYWFPPNSAARFNATLTAEGTGFRMIADDQPEQSGTLSDLAVSSRLGNIPRKITLPDGSIFESRANDAIDRMFRGKKGRLYKVERSWGWVIVALVFLGIVIFSGYRWGLPWVTDVIAKQIPDTAIQRVSDESLTMLDRMMFRPSEIPIEKQQQLTEIFNQRVAPVSNRNFIIHYRKMGVANALALPAGDLIVTDKFAEMASEEEFVGVMLHEIAHVEKRHGVKQLVRSSLTSFLVAMVAGNASGVEEIMLALPVFLLQSQYSQKQEQEADEFAFENMARIGIDPANFSSILARMSSATVISRDGAQVDNTGSTRMADYFSSHPSSADRTRRAAEYSQRFNSGG